MRTFIKITLITIGVIIIIAGIASTLLWKKLNEWDTSPVVNEYVISFEELDEKIYIRAKTWGISGNHSEILLSTLPINNTHREYMKDKQFTFINSTELYYQKKGIDSLLLYVDYKAEVPNNLSTQIKIKQIELKNANEIADYAGNYEKYGLEKISAYPKK